MQGNLEMLDTLAWILFSFLSGSLPFAVWIGKLALGKDIRQYGDHNPGMTNVLRAGGKDWGAVALLLDGFKGAIPVGLAYWMFGKTGWGMVLIAIAPVLGHAFSPFLKFRGGKAVAVTFGIWTGLTLFLGPTMLGVSLGLVLLVTGSEAWPLLPAMLTLLFILLLDKLPTWMLAVWTANLAVFFWKHRIELGTAPRLRGWLFRRFHLKDL
jgi:glycerol-3-phosphate acyltransferase PlsY